MFKRFVGFTVLLALLLTCFAGVAAQANTLSAGRATKLTVTALHGPSIIAGYNSVTQGAEYDRNFISSDDSTAFQSVEMDGAVLDTSCYTTDLSGSAIVIYLKADYIDSLSLGEHTLAIVSQGGSAVKTFTVKPQKVTEEQSNEVQPITKVSPTSTNTNVVVVDRDVAADNTESTPSEEAEEAPEAATTEEVEETAQAEDSAPAEAAPVTGDTAKIGLLVAVMTVCAAAVVMIITRRKSTQQAARTSCAR